MAKPDNREDNAVHLKQHIEHTEASLQEAEAFLDEHASEISADQKQSIQAKNERRERSIDAFQSEEQDETQ